MPGSSVEYEHRIFEDLGLKMQPPLRAIFSQYSLVEILKEQQSVDQKLREAFPELMASDWQILLSKICFAKVTAIELNGRFEEEYIYFLMRLLYENLTQKPAPEHLLFALEKALPHNYDVAHKWLANAKTQLEMHAQ